MYMKLVLSLQILSEGFIRDFANSFVWERNLRYKGEPIAEEFQHKINVCMLVIYKPYRLSVIFYNVRRKNLICVLLAEMCAKHTSRVLPEDYS